MGKGPTNAPGKITRGVSSSAGGSGRTSRRKTRKSGR